MQRYLYDVYTSAKGCGTWEIKAVSILTGATYVTDTRDSISIDNYKSEEEARRLEGYRVLLYYALSDNGKEVTGAPVEAEVKRALTGCKYAPNNLPLSGNYATLLTAYVWYVAGGDIEAIEEARKEIGTKTGKEVLDLFAEIAPDTVEAISAADVEAYAAGLEEALNNSAF